MSSFVYPRACVTEREREVVVLHRVCRSFCVFIVSFFCSSSSHSAPILITSACVPMAPVVFVQPWSKKIFIVLSSSQINEIITFISPRRSNFFFFLQITVIYNKRKPTKIYQCDCIEDFLVVFFLSGKEKTNLHDPTVSPELLYILPCSCDCTVYWQQHGTVCLSRTHTHTDITTCLYIVRKCTLTALCVVYSYFHDFVTRLLLIFQPVSEFILYISFEKLIDFQKEIFFKIVNAALRSKFLPIRAGWYKKKSQISIYSSSSSSSSLASVFERTPWCCVCVYCCYCGKGAWIY